ncbi:hypothetical protein [Sphingomonas sp. LB3N6]|uniref:hypothetical protein n=1 Tax=Sphingomonas fucosidasi TaxID=3096164 RepID=UPI003FA7C6A8
MTPISLQARRSEKPWSAISFSTAAWRSANQVSFFSRSFSAETSSTASASSFFNRQFSPSSVRNRAAADTVNRELTGRLFLDGQIAKVVIDGNVATPEGLFVRLEVTGTADLQYGKIDF